MSDMFLRAGATLQDGKYKIVKVLGQGGFGITYLAEQVMLDRKVALKEFFYKDCCERQDGSSTISLGTQASAAMVGKFKTKFLKEAKTISALDHPNIIRIFDIFEENNTAYYVMELVEGPSLSELVKSKGVLPEAKAIGYISQLGSALGYIHSLSVNHLDVKPGNVMVREKDDKVILIDFGLSKQYDSEGGQTSTTPVGVSQGYAPIEQFRPGGVSTFSPQTDIYALGATLYWLVVGHTPPAADEILSNGFPEWPKSVSSVLRNAIVSAMQPKKSDRPDDVSVFLGLLKTPVGGAGGTKGDGTSKDAGKTVDGRRSDVDDEGTRIFGDPGKKSGDASDSSQQGQVPGGPTGGASGSSKKKTPFSLLRRIALYAGAAFLGLMILGLVVTECSEKKSNPITVTVDDDDDEEEERTYDDEDYEDYSYDDLDSIEEYAPVEEAYYYEDWDDSCAVAE